MPFTPCRGAGGVPAPDGANGTLGRSEATKVPFARSRGCRRGCFRVLAGWGVLGTRKPPNQYWLGGFSNVCSAVSYSPTPCRVQYHRR